MKSLRRRLNLGLALILVVTFATQWLVASLAISYVSENQIASRLQHDGDSILASLEFGSDGRAKLDPARLALVYQQPFSGHYFLVQAGDQTLISRSLWDEDIAATPMPVGEVVRFHADGPRHQPLLAWTRGFAKQGHALSITVTEDLTAIWHDIARFKLGYLLFSSVMFLAAVLLQSSDIRRALRPVGAATANLALIAGGQMSRIEGESPTEIQPLVSEINRLLELVEHRLQQSRTAIGNLAHALKTPLAVIFQSLRDPRLQLTPELAEPIRQQAGAMQRLIEHELKRARLAGDRSSGTSFNPAADSRALVRLLQTIYADKGLQIELEAPNRLLPYDREDLLELLGNLADNACKWARRRVRVRIEQQRGLEIAVGDDGPGCAATDIEQLALRGARLDETKQGHGLGLAIVRAICDSYGGHLEFAPDADLGGFLVRAFLPAPFSDSRGPRKDSAQNAAYAGSAERAPNTGRPSTSV